MLHYTLKVAEVVWETRDTVTIAFKQPGLKKVKYLSGQYLTLIFKINNRRYIRPYSFSSAPGIDPTLNITVKRVSGGIVSNHIADCLNIGDVVEVMEPMGSFTLENQGITINSNIVLWGAGSGITPLLSIIKHALHHQVAKHVTLVYGNQNHESMIFNDQINALQKKYPNTFTVWHFHTKPVIEESNPTLVQGRIDPKRVIEVLTREKDLQDTFHYICGPAGLKESVKTVLEEHGVAAATIFSEDFNLAADPKNFEGIVTRKVIISKSGKLYPVEVVKGRTILDACLDALIDLSYSCQTGNCLLCKAKLLSGELRSIPGQATNYNLEKDEHLLCCSLPLTNDVELTVD